MKNESKHWQQKRVAVVKLQAAYRRWIVKMMIIWQKLRVLHVAENAWIAKLTRLERQRMSKMVGIRRYIIPRSLVPESQRGSEVSSSRR